MEFPEFLEGDCSPWGRFAGEVVYLPNKGRGALTPSGDCDVLF